MTLLLFPRSQDELGVFVVCVHISLSAFLITAVTFRVISIQERRFSLLCKAPAFVFRQAAAVLAPSPGRCCTIAGVVNSGFSARASGP